MSEANKRMTSETHLSSVISTVIHEKEKNNMLPRTPLLTVLMHAVKEWGKQTREIRTPRNQCLQPLYTNGKTVICYQESLCYRIY